MTNEVQTLFKTIKIQVSPPPKKDPIAKGAFYSSNLRIHPPKIHPDAAPVKPIAMAEPLKPLRINASATTNATKWLRLFPAGIFVVIITGLLGYSTSLKVTNVELKREIRDILNEYQYLDKERINLREELDANQNSLIRYGEKASDLESVNQFLIDRVSEQEQDLSKLNFLMNDRLQKLRLEMQQENELMRIEYANLLRHEKKPFQELVYGNMPASATPQKKSRFQEVIHNSFSAEKS